MEKFNNLYEEVECDEMEAETSERKWGLYEVICSGNEHWPNGGDLHTGSMEQILKLCEEEIDAGEEEPSFNIDGIAWVKADDDGSHIAIMLMDDGMGNEVDDDEAVMEMQQVIRNEWMGEGPAGPQYRLFELED